MTTDPSILLKQLQPAVLPGYATTRPTGPSVPLEHQRFDTLLDQARQGLVESGRTVSAGDATAEPLTPDQVQRLSSAADLAEASGARTALLMMDGRGLVLDVPTRTLTAELGADTPSRVAHPDTAVYVPGDDEATATLPPPGGVASRAVTDALNSRPSAA